MSLHKFDDRNSRKINRFIDRTTKYILLGQKPFSGVRGQITVTLEEGSEKSIDYSFVSKNPVTKLVYHNAPDVEERFWVEETKVGSIIHYQGTGIIQYLGDEESGELISHKEFGRHVIKTAKVGPCLDNLIIRDGMSIDVLHQGTKYHENDPKGAVTMAYIDGKFQSPRDNILHLESYCPRLAASM